MLTTKWGKALDREHPLPEYPRPQLRRESFLNLNGVWQYAVSTLNSEPEEYDGDIVVPFPLESELSGVGRVLQPGEYLWYRREFTLPEDFNVGRVLLHFGAVDQCARVWVNGMDACTHTGGYLPFSADITDLLFEGENTLVVRVTDDTDRSYHTRGKQKLKPGGIWYSPVSGIWQTVWCESVPENYISSLFITPHLEDGSVELLVMGEGAVRAVIDGDAYDFEAGTSALLKLREVRAWSPEEPVYLFAYLAAICRNRALTCLERERAAKRRGEVVALTEELEQCIPDRQREREADSRALSEALGRFLAGLGEENRRFFLRRYWYAESVREVAKTCGVSESKVKMSLHRTRKKLRAFLQEEGLWQ